MSYTLTQAAKAVGRTRQALQTAIKKGTISAQKDALGQWQIEPAELHRVYPPINQPQSNAVRNLSLSDSEKEAQIRELNAKLEQMEQRLIELKEDRDAWKNEAQDWKMQAKALPAGTPRPGFWKRLFG